MPKHKIPRKSTNIDMTAMCDVAFLLLSFFILATKTKPPEALAVTTPTSVNSKAAPDKSIVITISPEGKVFLLFGDDSKKAQIYADVNESKGLGLSQGELGVWNKAAVVGVPFNQVKPLLNMATPPVASQLPGIPTDTVNNQLYDWVHSITKVYGQGSGEKLSLLVKGDNNSKYPVFSNVLEALKKNDINKFKLVTSKEEIPHESELWKNPPKE